ncbi:MAG: OmpA family protein [Acidimicrobiales bacterium]
MPDRNDSDPGFDGFTTVEHDNLSEVVEMLGHLEQLKRRGLDHVEMATEMRASAYDPPGGGTWSPSVVAKVLGVVESVRADQPEPPGDRDRGYGEPTHTDARRPADTEVTADAGVAAGPVTSHRPSPPLHRRSGAAPPRSTETAPLTNRGRPSAVHRRNRRSTAVVAAGLVAVSGLVGIGVWLAASSGDDNSTTSESVSLASETTGGLSSTRVTEATITGGEEEDPADMMVIRVDPDDTEATDPATGLPLSAASATIRADGLLHLEGAFPSQVDANRFVDGLAAVFGRENLVETYEINPAAPLPGSSDVGLDKPVLFRSGTAAIDPSYIPYLEACGDVLKLNPHITMAIAAFTDSTGSAESNLELSRQRAQAIYDFYRSIDVSESQLQTLALGESEPVADNDTSAGREQNRRAVLRLLDVMANEAAAASRP